MDFKEVASRKLVVQFGGCVVKREVVAEHGREQLRRRFLSSILLRQSLVTLKINCRH
jgi:hypothetical protein